jgi:uncharacterized protein YxjI
MATVARPSAAREETTVTDADSPGGKFRKPQGETESERVRDQVQRQAGAERSEGGGGTLFTEPILVVNQKAKIIELTNEYYVSDQDGNRIGSVAEVGQSTAKKIARFVSSLDQFMTHRYEIRDAGEQAVLVLTRPRKIMKSNFIVSRPDGTEVGQVKQSNMLGKIKFALEAGGTRIGSLNAENWRAWNFTVQDGEGNEVARITKTWEGLAKTMFTSADNYVLEIKAPLVDPLLSLVVATALCVDTALKQDSRGFN